MVAVTGSEPSPVPAVAKPVAASMDITAGLKELHEPPATEFDNDSPSPWQMANEPEALVMGAGLAITVIVWVVTVPHRSVYWMVAVPGHMPVTRPVVAWMEATPGVRLTHVPPEGAAVIVVVPPWQIAGVGFMVGAHP